MRLSSSSSSPDCELTSAMADSSSRLMAFPWPLPPMSLVRTRRAGRMRVQVRTKIKTLSMFVDGAANERQNLAPMVLGMISERTRMSKVRVTAKAVLRCHQRWPSIGHLHLLPPWCGRWCLV